MSAQSHAAAVATDLMRQHPGLWEGLPGAASAVDVPPLTYLAIDGAGAPCDPPFGMAIGAVTAVAAAVDGLARMPVEVWFWTDPPEAFSADRSDLWLWTVAVAVPDWVGEDAVAPARAACPIPGADRLRIMRLAAGPSLQILHVGPYDDLRRSVGSLHAAMRAANLTFAGRHHEIYLDDPAATDPAALRTIIRQPVRSLAD